MTLLHRLASLWRTLFRKQALERDLDAELRAYADMVADQNIARGQGQADARRAALMELGGIEQVKESAREVRFGTFVETVGLDLRYAVRTLRRSPGFTIAAVLALALGIGATSAIFSVVNAVLLRPLPYSQPERLAVVLHHGTSPVAPANFFDWRAQNASFERMGAAEYWNANLSGTGTPERVVALRVTTDVLPLLGVEPLLGRVFTQDEKGLGTREAVLSHRLWQRRFAGNASALGQTLMLDGIPHVVIGVMPAGFEFPTFWAKGTQLWTPLALSARATSRNGNSLRVFARLKPAITWGQAQAQTATITARLEQEYPGTNRDVQVRSLDDLTVGDVRRPLLVLLCGVAFVLLIACANVAHMLLARAATREQEMALRAALGASGARLTRQLLTESLLLALFGGVAGVALAAAAVRALVAMGPAGLPRVETVSLDLRVLAATLFVSLLTGVAFGLAPARHTARRQLGQALREGGRGSASDAHGVRTRRLLVASELALSLVLLVGAGLMIRTFVALRAIDPGFDSRGVLTAVVSVTGSNSAEPGHRLTFYKDVLARVRAIPGVVSVSAINHLPLDGDLWGLSFSVEGRPRAQPGEAPEAAYRVVLPDYFHTMGLALVRGREIAESDDLRAPAVVVVNQALADRQWPGEDPIGKRLTFDDLDHEPAWLTVVGVARNAARHEWAAAPSAEIYVALAQNRRYLENARSEFGYVTLVARTRTDALARGLRSIVAEVDGSATVSSIQAMDDVVAQATATPRFYLLLLVTFALVALSLAAVGIYGVMSYSVARRTREIGLRMALGARPTEILRPIVGEAAALALAGTLVGILAALALTRLMASLLYGVRPTDAATFLATAGVLACVAASASYLPARRATRIDPVTALRHD